MIAWVTCLVPNEFVHCMGDTHVYNNHIKPLLDQCTRIPTSFPKMMIIEEETGESLEERKTWSVEKCLTVLESMEYTKFKLDGYTPQAKVVMQMSA